MQLNFIELEPECNYEAVARIYIGGGENITMYQLSLTTDATGGVTDLIDFAGKVRLPGADDLEFLKITNKDTGRVMDLRLHTAAARNDMDLALEAFDEQMDPNFRIAQGATPLHLAAYHGSIEIAMLLLENGAEVDPVDTLGWTPIALAANNDRHALVAELHERGAGLNININGESATIEIHRGGLDSTLLEAAKEGNVEDVAAALSGGADVNCTTSDGWTPLLSAAASSVSVVKLLLQHGADPNIPSDLGYTPLMRAAGNGQAEIVRVLLAANADREAEDVSGKSAFVLALEVGESECAAMVR